MKAIRTVVAEKVLERLKTTQWVKDSKIFFVKDVSAVTHSSGAYTLMVIFHEERTSNFEELPLPVFQEQFKAYELL